MKKVFVVDDEQIIADTLAKIIQNAGFNARALYSGDEALEAALLDPPDVIIADVFMPGSMSGIHLGIFAREHMPNTRIILLSGHQATLDLLKEAEARGYNFEIYAKPMHPALVLDLLRECNEKAA